MSSNGTVAAGFQRVLTKFSTRLTRDEQENFKFTTLNEVHQAIVDIQAQQAGRKSMRNLTRVLAFVEAMDQFGKVIEVFLNASTLLAFVWGPLKFLLLVTSNWAESFDTLLDAYQQIAENIPLLLQYQTLFEHNQHMSKVLEMIYEDILEFHQSALRMFGKSTLEQIFRAAWKTFKSRFQHILQDLLRHKLLIESQANALAIQEAQADRVTTWEAFKQIFVAQRNTQYLATQEWLSAVNMKVNQEGYAAIRHEYANTGKWVLTNNHVKSWLDPDNGTVSRIWLNGIPGAGKTILASLLVEEAQHIPNSSVLFFYCKHKDPQRSTFVAVARAILAQLLVQHREDELLAPFLYEQSLDSGESSLNSLKLCNSLLKTAFDILPDDEKVYIVIDGIDECEPLERKEILSAFSSVITKINPPGKIKGLFISQDEKDIRTSLQTAASIQISESDIEDDIKCFTDHWASKISIKFNLPIDKVEHIARMVCRNADGMFLFVKLVMNSLYSQTTRAQLYNELQKECPRGLDQAYKRIVERIYGNENEAEREQAQKILGWLVCAKRPLKWHEIQGAISIDVDNQTVDFENRQLMSDIQELCGSLVERLAGDRIELVHSTAKFYLTQKNQENCFIRMAKEEGRLAALCLQYLTFESLACESSTDEVLSTLVFTGFYAFLDYATLHWVDHLEGYLKTLESEDLDDLEALSPIGEDFFAIYSPDVTLDEDDLSSFEITCEKAREQSSFATLVSLIVHARQARSKAEGLSAFGSLGPVNSKARDYLEAQAESSRLTSAGKNSLHRYYGRNCFKCPRHLCFYFHNGFSDAKSRDHHLSRHDLPYCCTHDGCSRMQTGFSSERELKVHLKKNHPDPESLFWKFPKPPKPTINSKQKNQATFHCTLCPKRFTRAHSLRSHLRTHTDERPFVCTVCGKAFTRNQDRSRHEKRHMGEQKFVCKGDLETGDQWGCGRRFARADALNRHFRTEAGRLCIKSLADEEAIKGQQTWANNQRIQQNVSVLHHQSGETTSTIDMFNPDLNNLTKLPPSNLSYRRTGGPGLQSNLDMGLLNQNELPKALLEQYPALTALQWPTLPVGEADFMENLSDEHLLFDEDQNNTQTA
ncbi:hypothetical protein F5884DRAFT_318007 [Xylogone sp. PMI_703]|nr:hypothetical protein F5884DRAFT_318007 [Xylogone sp. PMI_703]